MEGREGGGARRGVTIYARHIIPKNQTLYNPLYDIFPCFLLTPIFTILLVCMEDISLLRFITIT